MFSEPDFLGDSKNAKISYRSRILFGFAAQLHHGGSLLAGCHYFLARHLWAGSRRHVSVRAGLRRDGRFGSVLEGGPVNKRGSSLRQNEMVYEQDRVVCGIITKEGVVLWYYRPRITIYSRDWEYELRLRVRRGKTRITTARVIFNTEPTVAKKGSNESS